MYTAPQPFCYLSDIATHIYIATILKVIVHTISIIYMIVSGPARVTAALKAPRFKARFQPLRMSRVPGLIRIKVDICTIQVCTLMLRIIMTMILFVCTNT